MAICWHEGGEDSIHDGYNIPGGHDFKMDDNSATSSNQLQLIPDKTFVLEDMFHCRSVGESVASYAHTSGQHNIVTPSPFTFNLHQCTKLLVAIVMVIFVVA